MPLAVGGNSVISSSGGSSGYIEVSLDPATVVYGEQTEISVVAHGVTPASYTYIYPIDSVQGNYYSRNIEDSYYNIDAIGTFEDHEIQVIAFDDSGNPLAVGTAILTIYPPSYIDDYETEVSIVGNDKEYLRSFMLTAYDTGFINSCTAIYPTYGGTASNHKWNILDPRDLDGAYRATFAGGITHGATGIKGNGVNTSMNTHIKNNTLGQNSFHISFYNRTSGASGHDGSGGTTPRTQIAINSGSSTLFDVNNTSGTGSTTPPTSLVGWWVLQRTESGTIEIWLNGTCIRKMAATSSTPSATDIYFMCFGNGGSPILPTNREYCFFSVGSALTSECIARTNVALYTLQNNLGRA